MESVADATLADLPILHRSVSGRPHFVHPTESPALTQIGRYGWKSQVATAFGLNHKHTYDFSLANLILTEFD